MDAHAHPDRSRGQSFGRFRGRPRERREGDEEGIALRVDFDVGTIRADVLVAPGAGGLTVGWVTVTVAAGFEAVVAPQLAAKTVSATSPTRKQKTRPSRISHASHLSSRPSHDFNRAVRSSSQSCRTETADGTDRSGTFPTLEDRPASGSDAVAERRRISASNHSAPFLILSGSKPAWALSSTACGCVGLPNPRSASHVAACRSQWNAVLLTRRPGRIPRCWRSARAARSRRGQQAPAHGRSPPIRPSRRHQRPEPPASSARRPYGGRAYDAT